jgi:hypothetical protein
MTRKEIVLWLVLADFVALTAYVVAQAGLSAFVPAAIEITRQSPWGLQLLVDFGIAIALILAWMVTDARARGFAAWPYMLLTLCRGTIGPLAYLIRRERQAAAGRAPA